MPVPRTIRAVGLGLAGLLLAACGSTAQVTGAPGQQQLGADGLGGLAPAGSTGGVGSGSTGSAGTPTTSPLTGTTTGAGPSAAPSPLATTGALPTAGSVGGLAKGQPVRIGVLYQPGIDKAAAALGINGLTTGDTKAQAELVISWIKGNGGFGGHPIQVFSYAMDLNAGSTDAAYEAACTKMTEDLKVRFVVSILSLPPGFLPCLAKRGVALLDDETGITEAAMAQHANLLANPGELATGRMLAASIEDFWKRGWLNPSSKVGIMALDNPDAQDVVHRVLEAGLRRHGLTPASVQYVTSENGINRAGSVALQFRAAGVDRVFSVGYSPLFLMQASSSQGYHPAYAMSSNFGPGALLEGTAPKDQLVNSAGIGWQPYLDIGRGTKPGPVSKRESLCFEIMAKGGQGSTAGTVRAFQLQVCNVLFYLQDVTRLLPSIPQDVLTAGRRLIGASYDPADTFRVDVTRRTDGVAGYRSTLYKQECQCYQYVSPVQVLP
jgi:hypothetical protein